MTNSRTIPDIIIEWLVEEGTHMSQSDVDTLVKLLRRYYRGPGMEVSYLKEPFDDTRIRWDVSVTKDGVVIDSIVVHGPRTTLQIERAPTPTNPVQ